MKKTNTFLVVIFSLIFLQGNFAQIKPTSSNALSEKKLSEKMIHMIGTATYTDVYVGPISEQTTTTTDPFGNTTTNTYYCRVLGISYLTLIYGFRYNITEINDEFAFGVSAFPSLGIVQVSSIPNASSQAITMPYTGVFSLPIMAGLSFGAAATQSSSSRLGVFLAVGYEFNNVPMFYSRTIANKDMHTHWVNPCLSFGIKYPSRNQYLGNLNELNLKVGIGIINQDIKTPNNLGTNGYTFNHPFTFRLSYFVYINQ